MEIILKMDKNILVVDFYENIHHYMSIFGALS